MTTVSNVNQEIKVMFQEGSAAPTSSSSTADAQLREAFTFEQTEEVPQTKPLTANDLDYSNFKKRDRASAAEKARGALDRVKDGVRRFNAEGNGYYNLDLTTFPRPEKYTKDRYGGKDEALSAWKDDVDEWVGDQEEAMLLLKSNNIGNLAQQFINAINTGFFNIYLQMGITRDEIQQVYNELNGNISAIKVELDRKASQIMNHSSSEAQALHQHLDDVDGRLYGDILDAQDVIVGALKDEGESTRGAVNTVGQTISSAITTDGDLTRSAVSKAAQESQEIESLSTAISAALHDSQDVERWDETLNEVEALKTRIISSNKINHAKKMELLNKLLNLINTDACITDGDLEAIHTETKDIL